ncbi:MAG TPA: hypothetical protein VHO25_22030 [Polyangiaceae bacterium]|nr:hypothetical protein [Polyangiaceae bacterium]
MEPNEMQELEMDLKLTILLIKDGPVFVAQCLEHDIAAQGKTLDECKSRFMVAFSSQVVLDLSLGKKPLQDCGQAPYKYFEKSLGFSAAGPELPVYLPIQEKAPHIKARAQFVASGQYAGAAP